MNVFEKDPAWTLKYNCSNKHIPKNVGTSPNEYIHVTIMPLSASYLKICCVIIPYYTIIESSGGWIPSNRRMWHSTTSILTHFLPSPCQRSKLYPMDRTGAFLWPLYVGQSVFREPFAPYKRFFLNPLYWKAIIRKPFVSDRCFKKTLCIGQKWYLSRMRLK